MSATTSAALTHHLHTLARDRGCTKPGCFVPGYDCEVHHARDWSAGRPTDADNLYFGCGTDHAAATATATDGTYTATVTDDSRITWSDGTGPPRVNDVHHPERLLEDKDGSG